MRKNNKTRGESESERNKDAYSQRHESVCVVQPVWRGRVLLPRAGIAIA
jgi:hypothetical protein